MEREKITRIYSTSRIGPVCRFGPGGEFTSTWPADWANPADQPKNPITKLLNVLAGVADMLRGQESHPNIEIIGPMEIVAGQEIPIYELQERRTDIADYTTAGPVAGHDNQVSGQPGLFADDWRAGETIKHKPNHRVRAHRAVAKKRTCFAPAESRTLFELDFKGAKTA